MGRRQLQRGWTGQVGRVDRLTTRPPDVLSPDDENDTGEVTEQWRPVIRSLGVPSRRSRLRLPVAAAWSTGGSRLRMRGGGRRRRREARSR